MEFNKFKLKELLQVNPRMTLKKGSKAKKIAMENIKEFQKKIDNFTIEEFKSGSKFQNGDTLLARITPCLENGKTAYVDILEDDEIAFGSTEFFVLRPIDNKLDSQFLYYLFRTKKVREIIIKSMTGTSGRQRAQKDSILEYKCEVPTIEYQRKIAIILKNLDDKIEINKKIIANLEELSQTLFKRWFVDFEFPDENGNPYKSSGGKMIDSELGKIPNDWKISNFQEITAFNTEIIDTNQLENPLNYIGLEHISRNNIISIDRWENTSKVTGKKLKVCKGDILFGKLRPYFQKVGISPIDGVVSTDIMIFTPSFKNVYYFILLYLSQKNFIRYITSTSTGTRMPRTGKKQINSYKIVLPTNLILTSFNTILNRYTDLIKLLINENAKLIQLRDTLLPKLMSGEIEMPDDIEVNNDELSI